MIVEMFMKSPDHDIRVVSGNRWMVYDQAAKCWEVYERKYGQKNTRTVLLTTDISGAMRAVTSDS